jgi:guanylate kinase
MTKSSSNNEFLWNREKKPLLLVLSGPSGAGKDAVLNRLKKANFPIAHITTMTTRAKRPREKDGVDYNFVTKEQFTETFTAFPSRLSEKRSPQAKIPLLKSMFKAPPL